MDDEEQDRECALPVIGTAARQVNPSVKCALLVIETGARQVNPSVKCALSVIGMGTRPQLTVIGSRS